MFPSIAAGKWFEPLRSSDNADTASNYAKIERWNGKCVSPVLGKFIFYMRQAFSKSVSSRLRERNNLRCRKFIHQYRRNITKPKCVSKVANAIIRWLHRFLLVYYALSPLIEVMSSVACPRWLMPGPVPPNRQHFAANISRLNVWNQTERGWTMLCPLKSWLCKVKWISWHLFFFSVWTSPLLDKCTCIPFFLLHIWSLPVSSCVDSCKMSNYRWIDKMR